MLNKLSKASKKVITTGLAASLIFSLIFTNFSDTAQAEQTLQINNLQAAMVDGVARITWNTDQLAHSRVEFGLTANYGQSINAQVPPTTNHRINLGLQPDKTYHYRVISYTADDEVMSFDQVIRTGHFDDHIIPTIKNFKQAYITGTTVTFQWETSEPTSYSLSFGKTDAYGKKISSSRRRTVWEVTVNKLQPDTLYHYEVKVKDKDNHVVTRYDKTFRTLSTNHSDLAQLTITNIHPTSDHDAQIRSNQAVISWQTNKLANCEVVYGTKENKLNKKAHSADPFKTFDHQITLDKLKPETTYYFQSTSKDIFGKNVKSEVMSFTTPALPISAGQYNVQLAAAKANKTPATILYQVNGKIYALLNQRKHYVRTPEIFSRNGYEWSAVQAASLTQVNAIPDVTLIKSPNNATVYYLYHNADGSRSKLDIPSAAVFTSYPQNRWNNIVTVDQLDVDSYSNVTLIKASTDATVYLLENGRRRPIMSEQIFISHGYQWTQVKTVSPAHLQSYPVGSAV